MKDIELPPLSKFDHPEPRTMQWSDLELYAIKSYARAAIEADRAQRVPEAAAAEREQCAKVCKNEMIDEEQCNDDVAYNAGCHDCAAAIRARGTK